MKSFAEVSAVVQGAEGSFSAEICESWYQGPGAYGGLTMALLVRGAEAHSRGRPLRALQATFCAPLRAGEVSGRAREVRRGGRVSYVAAELLQGGSVAASALLTFAKDRHGDADYDHVAPHGIAPAEECPQWPRHEGFPVFTQHLEYRQGLGAAPVSGHEGPAEIGGWVRILDPPAWDSRYLLALLDAWPPAFYPRLATLRPAGSVTISAELHHGGRLEQLAASDPLLVTNRSSLMRAGYASEENWVYGPEGGLLARASQLVALIR